MDTELFELCKEVYERTGWGYTKEAWAYPPRSSSRTKQPYVIENKVFLGMKENAPEHICPLYTSDYLLEKLPKEIDGYTVGIVWSNLVESWRGEYGNNNNHVVHADTPLKALLKLTIALDDAKELNG